MKKVDFVINRKSYQLVVESEQAVQLQQLAAEVDARASKIAASNPQADEATVLMMTCLIIADELYEARQEAGALHETFMLSQPEMQTLFPLTHFHESEKKINDLMDGMVSSLDKIIRPSHD
jgi:cell division protein ZapA (FtsZ GTPase activity inhibitor)